MDNFFKELELDELYWFLSKKAPTKTRENVYLLTMVSQNPRQIVGFDAARDKTPRRVQRMVDGAPQAERYCTDGEQAYSHVNFPGEHIQNSRDKSDTHNVESVNADLRHYIPVLARRSRCFARKLETLKAVVEVYVDAYNQFGRAKLKWRLTHDKGEIPFSALDFL